MARTKQAVDLPKCPLCGGDMPTEYTVNFEQVTGRADYRLPFASRMKMCSKCNADLIKGLTFWFHHVNKMDEYKKPWIK